MPYHKPHHKEIQKLDYLDSFMSVVAVAGPLSITPQVYQIWTTQNVSGISLATWTISACTSFIWLAYGLHHKERPIIYNSTLGIFFCSMIIFGVLIHK